MRTSRRRRAADQPPWTAGPREAAERRPARREAQAQAKASRRRTTSRTMPREDFGASGAASESSVRRRKAADRPARRPAIFAFGQESARRKAGPREAQVGRSRCRATGTQRKRRSAKRAASGKDADDQSAATPATTPTRPCSRRSRSSRTSAWRKTPIASAFMRPTSPAASCPASS